MASVGHGDDGSPDDATLLRATAQGDVGALEVLYRRHAPWLLARLGRRCDDPAVVDEVVQDTFVAVWRSASRWRGDGEVGAWIWGIAVRRLIDALRRRPGATLVALPSAEAEQAVSGQAVSGQAFGGVSGIELDGLRYGDLAGALAGLSPELRAVVQATVLDGLTTRQAAVLLGIPAGTVKTRMLRARAQLRQALA